MVTKRKEFITQHLLLIREVIEINILAKYIVNLLANGYIINFYTHNDLVCIRIESYIGTSLTRKISKKILKSKYVDPDEALVNILKEMVYTLAKG